MFAIALWDSRDNSLFLARDHLGQKPLFFARQNSDFLFASEVKAILASGMIEARPNIEALQGAFLPRWRLRGGRMELGRRNMWWAFACQADISEAF